MDEQVMQTKIKLSKEDAIKLVEKLDSPIKINQRFLQAACKYKEDIQ